ncbi:hypothetical protein [Streptomyces sp. H27-S2]|uniref:hypothetical protein n=1 Tax=Streptomyces antarcticus TaxID=2996458 RepID=UPI0022706B86|nr:hypothetical protein [Streptomyces sp. H27-S2]MCY0950740.1 hypothetical protein [Streptomyces sp. H27-S2]
MLSAAVIAAGVGLIPGLAHAADPVQPTKSSKPDAHGVDSTPDLTEVGQQKFSSPAERTVQFAPKVDAKSTAAPQAQDAVAAADPTVGLSGWGTSARGVHIDATVTNPDSTLLSLSVEWGDGSTDQFNVYGNETVPLQHSYKDIGYYTAKVTLSDNSGARAVNTMDLWTLGSDFTPHTPTRLLDTRDGTGAPRAKVAGFGTVKVKIEGNAKIPAGVTAVVLNVTVTNATSSGHITAYGSGDDRPTSSNVNYNAGQTVPNLVIVPVGEDGYVDLYNRSGGTVDLIADVTGYFTHTTSSGYTPLAPSRLVDTRSGLGTQRGQVPGAGTFNVQIAGRNNVPASGVTAVALNVTITEPKSDGHLSVFPSGQQATTSNLNFSAGQTIANAVIVPVGQDGKISVRNGAWGATDVIVDVVGFYSPAGEGAYRPVQPERLLDTRGDDNWDSGPLDDFGYAYIPLGHNRSHETSWVLNTTVTDTKANGFLGVVPDPNTVYAYDNDFASWPPAPTSSTLNWTPGKTVPNLVQATGGPDGIVDFFNQSYGTTHLIVDIFGYYDKS